jgi:hypothetical protein
MRHWRRSLTPAAPLLRQHQQTRDAGHRNENKTADHGESVFVDTRHRAPHGHIAWTNRIVAGCGLNSCCSDATSPFSTGARRWQKLALRQGRFSEPSPHQPHLGGLLFLPNVQIPDVKELFHQMKDQV